MSNFYIDMEFHERKEKSFFCKEFDTIDLISIGIVSEYNRELYLIHKDFDVKAAFNNDWIKDNVLKSIYNDWCESNQRFPRSKYPALYNEFNTFSFKQLLTKFGKTKQEIASAILEFMYPLEQWQLLHPNSIIEGNKLHVDLGRFATVKELLEWSVPKPPMPEIYGYYCGYDLVLFEQIFGGMKDYPHKHLPMYFIDLKQELDKKANKDNYPKQTNEHNSLFDARFNKELYKFLENT